MYWRDEEILKIFRELPEQRGCSEADIRAAEAQLHVTLPAVYTDLMRLAENRLVVAGIVLPIRKLVMERDEAIDILIQDNYEFRLDRQDVVFTWELGCAFYFFHADGSPDPPVMAFNYAYASRNDWRPAVTHPSLTKFFAENIKRYFELRPGPRHS